MKTKYIIVSISLLVIMSFWLIGGSLMGIGMNPIGIIGVPLAISQLIFSEGHTAICFESCGPCASFGPNHIQINGKCKLPESVEECNTVHPEREMKLIDNKCVPQNTVITLDKP